MSLLRPFRGLRPVPRHAEDVIAPPYDVLNAAEARQQAAGRPLSFLHISKPEIDLPPETDPYAAEVYTQGANSLARLLDQGVLARDEAPCYYAYRLTMGEHVQTGLVAVANVRDYDSNRIRKHEFTRPAKEDDRVRQIGALNMQTSPVFLTYRQHTGVDALMEQVVQAAPEYDVTAADGVRHCFWVIRDAAAIEQLTAWFDAMDYLYIADGHHRSAAASRVAAERRAGASADGGEPSYEYFLAVIFPDNQMQILDYNRVVTDLNGLSTDQFLDAVGQRFTVQAEPAAVRPAAPGEFGLYLPGQWYRLRTPADAVAGDNPVARLDVSVLAERLLAPVLGIEDPRRDARIDFVGGIRGLQELERRVDSGEMAVAFALYPTRLQDLMAVADAGEVMPPKSTWFEPKLADGLITHVLD